MTSLCDFCRAWCYWYCRSSSTEIKPADSSNKDSSYIRVEAEDDPEMGEKSPLVEEPNPQSQPSTLDPSLLQNDKLRKDSINSST
jgi:hypothetical protein